MTANSNHLVTPPGPHEPSSGRSEEMAARGDVDGLLQLATTPRTAQRSRSRPSPKAMESAEPDPQQLPVLLRR
jgi:hypothetical protein